MFWNKKKTIRVLFIDVASGTTIAKTDSPPDQLPATFEAHTTIQMKGHDWEVLSAAPVTRAEYVKAGELRLTVRLVKVQNIPPDKLLFSLPTICDAIPGVAEGSSKLGKNVLDLHEDDWRQVELVAVTLLDEARACLAKIERVHAEERTPGGAFKKLHVRSELAAPITRGALRLATLQSAFSSGVTAYDGLAYRGVAGLVEGGFAFKTGGGLAVYGVEAGGGVTTVGLVVGAKGPDLEADARGLARLLRESELALIDWCRVEVVGAEDAQVLAYLRGTDGPG
jgi:hypothetical protein